MQYERKKNLFLQSTKIIVNHIIKELEQELLNSLRFESLVETETLLFFY